MRDLTKLAYELFEVADELYAREYVRVSLYPQFENVSWEELCDKGIEILEELKVR